MQYIVQPVLEKGANHPTFTVNTAKTYAIGSVSSKRVLQANGPTLTEASWNESTSGQRWKLERLASGRYKICCASMPAYCLEGATAGGAVNIASWNDSAAQTWELVPMGGAIYHLRSSVQGQVLAESSGSFVLAPEHIPADDSAEEAQKNPEQRFVLAEVQPNALADTYSKTISVFSSADYGGERRDIALGKYDNGVPGERVWRMRNLGSRNYLGLNNEGGVHQNAAQAVGWLAASWRQIFRIEPVPGTSYYRIFETGTGLVLALGPSDLAPGSDVKGFPPGDHPAGDLWEIRPLQGCFLIVAAGTNLAMEHYHEANEEWVELQEVAPERGDLQRWVLEDETAWEVDTTKEYKLYNRGAEKWLHAHSASEPRVSDSQDTLQQIWRFTKAARTADGWQIYSVESLSYPGKALSMPHVANEQPLCLGGANARWFVVRTDDGSFRLRAEGVAGPWDMTTRGLEDTTGVVTAYEEVWNEYHGNQEWVLVDRNECTVAPDKRYVITSDSGLALTEQSDASATYGSVYEREVDHRPEQTWRIEHDAAADAYHVINTSSNRVLEVQGKSMVDGARVQTSNLGEQHWRLNFLRSNTYTLTAVHSGMVLDGTINTVGCIVNQVPPHGGANQTWHVIEIRDGRVISDTHMTALDFSPVAIRSLQVPDGVRVTLFDGPHLSGASKVLLDDASDIGAFNVVSLLVEPIATLRTASDTTWQLGIGEYTSAALSDLGINPAELTIINVPQGMQVEVFDVDDFYGEQRVLYFNAPTLAQAGVTGVKSIRVKAAGVVVPAETLRYGDIITLHSQRSGAAS